MKFSTLFLSTATAVVLLVAPSCKKKDDAEPSMGSISYNGKSIEIIVSSEQTTGSLYTVLGSGELDGKTYQVGVTTSPKPTASGDLTLGGSQLVTLAIIQSGAAAETHIYAKSTEKVTATVSSDVVKFSGSNLTETNASGAAVSGGKALTFSVEY